MIFVIIIAVVVFVITISSFFLAYYSVYSSFNQVILRGSWIDFNSEILHTDLANLRQINFRKS